MNKNNAREYIPLLEALADNELEMQTPSGMWQHADNLCSSFPSSVYRRRPQTFEAHGKTWTRHKPDDPMPCDGEKQVEVLFVNQEMSTRVSNQGFNWIWSKSGEEDDIIGWRYADQPAWKLPDPPAGKQWQRDGWEEKMLPDGYRPLLKGESEEVGDEFRHSNGDWEKIDKQNLEQDTSIYTLFRRTRRPLPVEPVMVPLGPEDVPPGSVLRWCGEVYWQAIVGTEPWGVYRVQNDRIGLITWEVLNSPYWTIKRPTDTDWQPCKKIKH